MMSNVNYSVNISGNILDINDIHGQRTYNGIFDIRSERFYTFRDVNFRPGSSVDNVKMYYDNAFNVIAYTEFTTDDKELLSSVNPELFKYNRMIFEFDTTSKKLMIPVPSVYHLCFDDTKVIYWASEQYKISSVTYSGPIVTIKTKGSDQKKTFILSRDENSWTTLMIDGRCYNIVDRHIKKNMIVESDDIPEIKTKKKVTKKSSAISKGSSTSSSGSSSRSSKESSDEE